MTKTPGYYESYWQNETGSGWRPDSGVLSLDEQELFATHLKPGTVCLDYGCGNAQRYGRRVAAQGVDYRGFDISHHAVGIAQDSGLQVHTFDESGRTSLSDSSMDVAICFEVLEHLMEPQMALAEIKRCLKPGGHALISVPNTGHYLQRLEFLFTGFWCPGGSPHTARKEPWCDPHIRFFSPAMLRRLVANCGLEPVEVRGEAFSFVSLPWVWRRPAFHPVLRGLSKPVAWLGRAFPNLFSHRLFAVARKPLA